MDFKKLDTIDIKHLKNEYLKLLDIDDKKLRLLYFMFTFDKPDDKPKSKNISKIKDEIIIKYWPSYDYFVKSFLYIRGLNKKQKALLHVYQKKSEIFNSISNKTLISPKLIVRESFNFELFVDNYNKIKKQLIKYRSQIKRLNNNLSMNKPKRDDQIEELLKLIAKVIDIRAEFTDQLSPYLESFNKIITSAPELDKEYTVYRGVKLSNSMDLYLYEDIEDRMLTKLDKYTINISKLKKGDTIDFDTFTSTSFSPNISNKFSDFHCCIFRMKLKKNTKGIFIGTVPSSLQREVEFILMPSKFKVTNITDMTKPKHNKYFSKVIYDLEFVKNL